MVFLRSQWKKFTVREFKPNLGLYKNEFLFIGLTPEFHFTPFPPTAKAPCIINKERIKLGQNNFVKFLNNTNKNEIC